MDMRPARFAAASPVPLGSRVGSPAAASDFFSTFSELGLGLEFSSPMLTSRAAFGPFRRERSPANVSQARPPLRRPRHCQEISCDNSRVRESHLWEICPI